MEWGLNQDILHQPREKRVFPVLLWGAGEGGMKEGGLDLFNMGGGGGGKGRTSQWGGGSKAS